MNRQSRMYLVGGVVAALAIATAVVLSSGPDAPESREAGGQTSAMEGMAPGVGDMDDMETSGSVRLTAAERTTFGITFGTAEVRPLSRTVRAAGFVEFDETRMAYVAPRFQGWAERLHADFTGQAVRAGEPLLEVYSPELVTAQEELLLAARMAEAVEGSGVAGVAGGAGDLLDSARRRLAYWEITDEQIERLLETGEVRRTLTLHAPVSGIVMEKDVFEGQAFQPGQNLYMIADLSQVWVNAELFEVDAALVTEGLPAEISVAALPGSRFRGRVEYVYPSLEDRTRSLRARVALPNSDRTLKPGMYATVMLDVDMGERLTVPASAVLHSGERAVAFVDMGGGELMPHELQLGVRGGEYVEVLAGLEAGQRVVTSAQFLLDSESNLAEVMRAMMTQMDMSDMGGMDMGTDGPDSMRGMDMGRDSGGGR